MKSVVSSIAVAAVLVATGVNAAPSVAPSALTNSGNTVAKPALAAGLTQPENQVPSLSGHGAHNKQQTLVAPTSNHHTSSTRPVSVKAKSRRTKHRKTHNETTEKKLKESAPASVSHKTSSSHTETSAARLPNPNSDAQPRSVSESDEALYARGKKSKKAKKARKARKAAKKLAAQQASGSGSEGGETQATESSEGTTRRELEEVLEARLFDNLKQKIREAKAKRLQKAAAKAQANADAAAIKAGIAPPTPAEPVAREIYEGDLDMRDLLEEEDLAAREFFDDDLEARSFGDFWHALTHKETPKEKAERLQHAADLAAKNAAAAAAQAGITTRDYLDDALEMREFYDDEELLAREYFDEAELDARDFNIWQSLNAVTRTFTPSPAKPKAPAAAPAAPAANGEAEARDVFDELDMRDFSEVDELD